MTLYKANMHGEWGVLSTHPIPDPSLTPSFLSPSFCFLPLSFLGPYTDPRSEKGSWGAWIPTIPSFPGLTVFGLRSWACGSSFPFEAGALHSELSPPWASLLSSLSSRRPSLTPCWPWRWPCTCQFCCGSMQPRQPSAQTCCSSSANWTNPITAPSAWCSTW